MRKVGPVMVAIFGSGHPIGAVLEALLRAAGFEARFLGTTEPERLKEALAGFQLVVICPASGIGGETVAGLLATGIPVLELVRDGSEGGRLGEYSVSWPCRVEVLEGRIRAALQTAARGCA